MSFDGAELIQVNFNNKTLYLFGGDAVCGEYIAGCIFM